MAAESIKKIKSYLRKFLSWTFRLSMVAVIIFVATVIYKNPDIFDKYLPSPQEQTTPAYVEDLYNKIKVLDDELEQTRLTDSNNGLDEAIRQVSLKYEAMEQQNLNVINSKADVAALLSLVSRLDNIEERVSHIAKVSDKGALILTATMYVKDRADAGGEFSFEAEVLNQLADGESRIKESVDTISKLALEGITTDYELINTFKFDDIATDAGLSWVERVKAKFNELVQVKKVNEAEDLSLKRKALVEEYVKSAKFLRAVEIIEQDGLKVDPTWVEKAKNKGTFDKEVSKISAYSLAVMKVNTIKNPSGE